MSCVTCQEQSCVPCDYSEHMMYKEEGGSVDLVSESERNNGKADMGRKRDGKHNNDVLKTRYRDNGRLQER